jgi:hypothetical protein
VHPSVTSSLYQAQPEAQLGGGEWRGRPWRQNPRHSNTSCQINILSGKKFFSALKKILTIEPNEVNSILDFF